MDRIYVVNGATLSCSCGSDYSKLKVCDERNVYTNGKLQANVLDSKPNLNIMPFSKCIGERNQGNIIGTDSMGRPQRVCVPIIFMEWINGKKDTLVEGYPALLDKSTIMCMCGGKIIIEDDGQ
jgi:hypothetical protein